jgi:hypothetical protein
VLSVSFFLCFVLGIVPILVFYAVWSDFTISKLVKLRADSGPLGETQTSDI